MLRSLKWGVPLVAAIAGAAACSAEFAETPTSSSGAGGSTSISTSSGMGGGLADELTTFVGQACTADELCGTHEDSVCITAETSEPFFTSFWGGDMEDGGGVAGGYCTRYCDADNPCPDGSRCGGNICLALCDFGSPELDALDAGLAADKCHGRDDLMCTPTAAGDSVCMPNCGAGAECGGRACDARYGVCTDPDRQGLNMGAACETDNSNTEVNEDPCAGLCLEIVDEEDSVQATICSARCSLGGLSNDCGGPEIGVCAIPRVDGVVSAGLGDEGYCASACVTHGECAFGAGLFCIDLGNHDRLGKGYCLSAQSCAAGEACADGEVCVTTAGGDVCLDDDGMGEPLFDLGAAAP